MASSLDRDPDGDRQLARRFHQQLRQRGYWDCLPNPSQGAALAGFNPNLSRDPETRFRIAWLLGSTVRRRALSAPERRLLEASAQELDGNQRLCPARQLAIARLYHRLQAWPQSA